MIGQVTIACVYGVKLGAAEIVVGNGFFVAIPVKMVGWWSKVATANSTQQKYHLHNISDQCLTMVKSCEALLMMYSVLRVIG